MPPTALLGDALQAATTADLAAPAPRWRRSSRRTAVALVAAAIAIPGAALAANELLSSEDVARSLPAGTRMLQGTGPSCTVVRDQVEYRCTLARAPRGEIAPGQFKGTVEPTVDKHSIVNGGCRSLTADGTEWSCYLGQAAVDQKIISQGFLGEKSQGPKGSAETPVRSARMRAWGFNGWTTSASWWSRSMPLSRFSRSWASARRASHDRRRLVRARHRTARPARRDGHDAHAGRPRPDRLSRFITPPRSPITATPR